MIFRTLKTTFGRVRNGAPLRKVIGLEGAENKGFYRYITTTSSIPSVRRDKFIFSNSLPYPASINPLAGILPPYPGYPPIYIGNRSERSERSQTLLINDLETPKKPSEKFSDRHTGIYR